MSRPSLSRRLGARCFALDESGATLVEFAIVLPLFLLIFFGLLDFGRLGFTQVMAEKATQRAARIAAVRPPVAGCAALLPSKNLRPEGATGTAKLGAYCRSGVGVCDDPGVASCRGVAGDPTSDDIWSQVAGLLPHDATVGNLWFSYSSDPNLGFLGGPYVPVVTVELRDEDETAGPRGMTFEFVSPLGALAALAGGTGAGGLGDDIVLPRMSVSLPGEDLAQGGG